MIKRHVILVGLPGSGKTTVGRLVAAALRAEFVDLDERIERRAGKSVPRIFAEDGEAAFRSLEAAAGAAALRAPPAVVAPGGGFFAGERTRELARSSGLVVYLETDPGEAVRRLGGAAGRPLLEGGDPDRKMASLLAARAPLYRESECAVDTTGIPAEEVARRVVSLARDRAGW
ncbi:MAG TPA: shikimate kinase [Gemmatimonadales bacterium]|nr:shikimate kinase [Gemmatimonadales bacterium]